MICYENIIDVALFFMVYERQSPILLSLLPLFMLYFIFFLTWPNLM